MMANNSFCFYLPYPILAKIFSSYYTNPNARLVCYEWKSIIDTIGLNLVIHEDHRASMRLSRSIVRSLKVVKFNKKTLFVKHPNYLEQLTCTGPTHPSWIKRIFHDCPFITRLTFKGYFFTHLDLCHSFRKSNEVFHGLRVLRDLEIIVDGDDVLVKTIEDELYKSWDSYEAVCAQKLNRLDRNVCIILNGVRSNKLTKLELRMGIEAIRDPPSTYPFNWRYKPLEKFLEFHKGTLKILLLPSFMGKMCMDCEEVERDLPNKLSTLTFRMQNFEFQDSWSWVCFLKSQTDLVNASLKLIDYDAPDVCQISSHVCMKNPNLQQLALQFGTSAEETWENPHPRLYIPIDCKMISHLQSLTKLTLECDAPEMTDISGIVIDFSVLPLSLEKLIVRNFVIRSVQAEDLMRLKKLSRLALDNIMLKYNPVGGLFKYFHKDAESVCEFVRSLVHHRKLDSFDIKFWNNVPFTSTMFFVIETLRPEYYNLDQASMYFRGIRISQSHGYPAARYPPRRKASMAESNEIGFFDDFSAADMEDCGRNGGSGYSEGSEGRFNNHIGICGSVKLYVDYVYIHENHSDDCSGFVDIGCQTMSWSSTECKQTQT